MGVEMGSGLQCMALQFLDSAADVLLRGGGEFPGQNLCALFDGVQLTGKAVPKLGQGRTDFLLDRCLRGPQHLGGLLPRLLQNARPQVLPQALPQLLFQLWRNISQRYLEAVALGVGGQLLAKFRDFRLQGPHERGQHASQAVFGELLFEVV